MKRALTAAIAALPVLAAPAFANTTTVACPGYVIALQDAVAIQAQVQIGSQSAFESIVCDRSASLASNVEQVETIPVFIEELNVATRVVIFSTDSE
jgi:hypothetical protein